ncbi:MAG: SpoIIE family protein phosphatase, partial [Bacteroidales bacterium]|nr:SpoIIE family protein phosphatase [Bacteroidales bacterium]
TVPFENTMFNIEPNDVLYLSTDGYTDQNNNEREKIGVVNLQDLIKEHGAQALEKQRDAYQNYLINHMGDEDQRDDISIIGISV